MFFQQVSIIIIDSEISIYSGPTVCRSCLGNRELPARVNTTQLHDDQCLHPSFSLAGSESAL